MPPTLGPGASVSRGVRLGYVEPVLARPGADLRRRGDPDRLGSPTSGTAADRTSVGDVRRQRVTQGLRVLGVEVDGVLLAVDPERHRLLGIALVDVIDEHDVHLLRHFLDVLPFIARIRYRTITRP